MNKPGSKNPPYAGNDVAQVLPEPGSCDAFTTGTDPTETEQPHVTRDYTPNGWTLRHTELTQDGWRVYGERIYRTEVIHPWKGTLAVFTWSQP